MKKHFYEKQDEKIVIKADYLLRFFYFYFYSIMFPNHFRENVQQNTLKTKNNLKEKRHKISSFIKKIIYVKDFLAFVFFYVAGKRLH